MDAGTVRTEREAQILVITLARAAKLNALTPFMVDALLRALEDAARDNDVRVVVLLGEGRAFCAGADVDSGLGLTEADTAYAYLSGIAEVLGAMSSLPKPVIAGVQGHAVGGGAELALEADLRVVAEDAVLAFPDVSIGSTPASAYQLVRHVGKGLAMEMVMLGTRLDALEMKRRRLAVDVVSAAELRRATLALAERLRDRAGPRSLRLAKEAVQVAEHASREVDLRVNVAAMLGCQSGDAQRDYVASFTNRRAR